MYSEDDYIQLSAIQHYVFCPRQCGLIHVYGLWGENMFTARGEIMHERVDSEEDEMRGDKHIVRSLTIISKRLGLSGRADVVEFTGDDNSITPYPVEYKSGQPKRNISDLAQLCAQSLCLEEMMNVSVNKAAIYYGKPRKRLLVEISGELRARTEEIINKIHRMIKTREVPRANYEKKCKSCSLIDDCMPASGPKKLASYIQGLYKVTDEETP